MHHVEFRPHPDDTYFLYLSRKVDGHERRQAPTSPGLHFVPFLPIILSTDEFATKPPCAEPSQKVRHSWDSTSKPDPFSKTYPLYVLNMQQILLLFWGKMYKDEPALVLLIEIKTYSYVSTCLGSSKLFAISLATNCIQHSREKHRQT